MFCTLGSLTPPSRPPSLPTYLGNQDVINGGGRGVEQGAEGEEEEEEERAPPSLPPSPHHSSTVAHSNRLFLPSLPPSLPPYLGNQDVIKGGGRGVEQGAEGEEEGGAEEDGSVAVDLGETANVGGGDEAEGGREGGREGRREGGVGGCEGWW